MPFHAKIQVLQELLPSLPHVAGRAVLLDSDKFDQDIKPQTGSPGQSQRALGHAISLTGCRNGVALGNISRVGRARMNRQNSLSPVAHGEELEQKRQERCV
jgi:hypothetical protein